MPTSTSSVRDVASIALALRVNLRRSAPPLHLVVVLAATMFGVNYALTYLAETHLAQMVIPRKGFAEVMNPATVQISYGLGWILQDYRGQRLLLHGGAIDGFRAHLAMVPEAQLGIVLLNNLDRGFMNLALSNALIDHILRLPYRDWNAYYLDIQTKEEARAKDRARDLRAARKTGTKPSLPLEAYTGKYFDAAYGTCEITLERGRLIWLWGTWRCSLEHFQDDTFLAHGEGFEDSPAEFRVGANRSAEAVHVIGRLFRRAM